MHPIDLIRGSSIPVRQNLTGVPEPDIQDAKISPEGTGIFLMDYFVIGSNGFARIGDPDYYRKSLIEMNYLLGITRIKFPIPIKFSRTCYFAKKSFPYKCEKLYVVVLFYDDIVLTEWMNSPNEYDQGLFTEFWDWFNQVETFNLESAEFRRNIQSLYDQSANHSMIKRVNLFPYEKLEAG
jgi:hypothetical protein